MPSFVKVLMAGALLLSSGLSYPAIVATETAQVQNAEVQKADRLLQQGIQLNREYALDILASGWSSPFNVSIDGQSLATENQQRAFKALQLLQQALTLYRELKDLRGEANALGNLGLTYIELENYSQATEVLEQGLTIARTIQDPQSEALALANLGLVYYATGDYQKAIAHQQQSLAIARKLYNSPAQSLPSRNINNSSPSDLEDYTGQVIQQWISPMQSPPQSWTRVHYGRVINASILGVA